MHYAIFTSALLELFCVLLTLLSLSLACDKNFPSHKTGNKFGIQVKCE